ncbi:MAG: hypothetical protein ACE5KA_04865, partial [Nitrososphaerales archaeon]
NGEGVAKAPIILKSENGLSRGIIAAGSTDDDGRFSIQWVVESDEKSSITVYGSYMGSADYAGSESEKFIIEVERVDLIVQTNQEIYRNDDQLIIFGSSRPHDILSVFVTRGQYTVLATQILVDANGKFSRSALNWDNTWDTGPYYIYVRSTTDVTSSERVVVHFVKEVIQQPQGKETIIILDPPRYNVTLGDNLLLTGSLQTKTGLPIMEATVLLMYEDNEKDGILTEGITWGDGRFLVNWQASQVTSSNALKVYATFEGGNGFLSSISDEHEIEFKPRRLTLQLNKAGYQPADPIIVSGLGPAKEWLDVMLIDQEGQTVVAKNFFVGPDERYEKTLMHWMRPSYVLPEGEYTVMVTTEKLPEVSVSETLRFEEYRPLSEYKLMGSVLYADSKGDKFPVPGVKVKIVSPYGEIESYADNSGKFVFQDLDAIIHNLKNVFSVMVELDGKYFRLVDGSNSKILSERIGPIKFDGALHDINLEPIVFSGKSEAAAARIFAFQNDIVRYYIDVIGIQAKKIDIEIFSKETPKGKYGYEMDGKIPKIWIGKGTSSPRNPYTWDTLAHEYTHYMQDLYASVDHYSSMNHGGFSNPTTADSMVEGFADFMSAAISQHYENERAGKFLRHSLDFNFQVNSPDSLSEELAIAGIFWDLYDDAENDDDEISIGIKKIWRIMSAEYNFPTYREDSGIIGMERHVYYVKDLHYLLVEVQNYDSFSVDFVEEVFNSHGIIDGFTDPERPNRI